MLAAAARRCAVTHRARCSTYVDVAGRVAQLLESRVNHRAVVGKDGACGRKRERSPKVSLQGTGTCWPWLLPVAPRTSEAVLGRVVHELQRGLPVAEGRLKEKGRRLSAVGGCLANDAWRGALLVVVDIGRDDGAEDFLLHETVVRVVHLDKRGLDVVALAGRGWGMKGFKSGAVWCFQHARLAPGPA